MKKKTFKKVEMTVELDRGNSNGQTLTFPVVSDGRWAIAHLPTVTKILRSNGLNGWQWSPDKPWRLYLVASKLMLLDFDTKSECAAFTAKLDALCDEVWDSPVAFKTFEWPDDSRAKAREAVWACKEEISLRNRKRKEKKRGGN